MSMRTETLSLVISGDGKLLGVELGRQEKRVKTFGDKVGGMFTGMGKQIGGAVGKLANPLALIGGTAGVLMAARDLMEYENSLTSLGITAGLTAGDMMALDTKIHGLAYTTGQSREKIVAALKDMASNVDTEFAVAAIEDVSKAAGGLDIDITAAARAFTAFRRDMRATNEEAAALFNTTVAMGNAFTLDRLSTAVSTLGLTKDNFADYNAWVQTIKPNFGGVEVAAKAIENIAMSIQTHKRFRHVLGPDIINADGTIKDFKGMITKISGMSAKTRKAMFGNMGKAFLPFSGAGDGFKVFDEYMAKGQEAGFVTDALARRQQTAKFQMNALTTAAKEFAGTALSPALADLTKQMNDLVSDPEKMEMFRAQLARLGETAGYLAQSIGLLTAPLKMWSDMWGAIGDMHGQTVSMPRKRTDTGWNVVTEADGKMRAVPRAEYVARQKAMSPSGEASLRRLQEINERYTNPPPAQITVPKPEVKNNIVINQQITGDGRVITEVSDPNTSITTNMNRGPF